MKLMLFSLIQKQILTSCFYKSTLQSKCKVLFHAQNYVYQHLKGCFFNAKKGEVMRVKAKIEYNDLELGRIVSVEEEIKCSKERAELLISKGFCEEVKKEKELK